MSPRLSNNAPTLQSIKERAKAKLESFRRMLPEDRLREFARQGFFPHGYYLPDDGQLRAKVRAALKKIGAITDDDERMRRYHGFQVLGVEMEARGVPGRWTGQQGVARSNAIFRLVEWGRRSGKTLYAASEIVAVMRSRPRSTCWAAAKTYDLCARVFDMVERMLTDLGEDFVVHRNTQQNKLLVLKNGSRCEGISLENFQTAAGAAVDFCVVDEAAQIEGDSWYRAILPPLADRRGQALLISSHEGDETFFYKKAQEAKGDGTWQVFQDATWDVNFYMFPQGRESESIRTMEANMDPVDFLEQFGAIPARPRNLVFPEFREIVHVGEWPFNPKHPVILAIDPSGGANPYAVAVIQDYQDFCTVVDEFYRTSITAEEVSAVLQTRPWRKNVVDVIVDSAIPTEVQRWARLGWPARPVFEKPRIEERTPLYRNLLRDPRRYAQMYRREVNAVLAARGLLPDADLSADQPWTAEQQRELAIEVTRRLADEKELTEPQREGLRDCARLFFDKSCYWSIQEHFRWKYMKVSAQSQSLNPREKPADSWNHILDALGYFVWMYHRFDGEQPEQTSKSVLRPVGRADVAPEVELPRSVTTPDRMSLFVRELRGRYTRPQNRTQSILRTVS